MHTPYDRRQIKSLSRINTQGHKHVFYSTCWLWLRLTFPTYTALFSFYFYDRLWDKVMIHNYANKTWKVLFQYLLNQSYITLLNLKELHYLFSLGPSGDVWWLSSPTFRKSFRSIRGGAVTGGSLVQSPPGTSDVGGGAPEQCFHTSAPETPWTGKTREFKRFWRERLIRWNVITKTSDVVDRLEILHLSAYKVCILKHLI